MSWFIDILNLHISETDEKEEFHPIPLYLEYDESDSQNGNSKADEEGPEQTNVIIIEI
tara:strand:- start:1065 stop:1238 length:174 start_codon:yes stop_codon:yes gene_type:complete